MNGQEPVRSVLDFYSWLPFRLEIVYTFGVIYWESSPFSCLRLISLPLLRAKYVDIFSAASP